jgi:hypothetical protein
MFNFDRLGEIALEVQEPIMKIAWSVLIIYFLLIMTLNILNQNGEIKDLLKIIGRVLIVVILLTNIIPLRSFFVKTSGKLASGIYEEEKLREFRVPINEEEKEKHFFKINVMDLIFNGAKVFYGIISKALFFFNHFLHFIAFIMAPIAIVPLVSNSSQNVTVGFFKRFLALCLWEPYIACIYRVLALTTSESFVVSADASVIFQSVIYLIILSVLLVTVPLFASQFVSGMWGMAENALMQNIFRVSALGGFSFATGRIFSPLKSAYFGAERIGKNFACKSAGALGNSTRKIGSYGGQTVSYQAQKIPQMNSILNKTKALNSYGKNKMDGIKNKITKIDESLRGNKERKNG